MDALDIVILGSASGKPEPDRSHASIALLHGADVWLLDAGEGVTSSLLQCGIKPENVRGVFITHLHPDHCVGVFMLLQYLHMEGWCERLPIFLPGGAIETVQVFMNQLYLVPGEINPHYELLPLQKHHNIAKELSLATFPTHHLQHWEEREFPGLEVRSYAFRVHSADKGIFYSGDISSLDDIKRELRADDLLILESAHITADEVLDTIANIGVKRMVLTHSSGDMRRDLEELQTRAQKAGTETFLAYDGLKIQV